MNRSWPQLRKQWFRILLLLLSLAFILGAVTVVFQSPPVVVRATPLPVGANEYEIAWLYPATNTPTWERFVAAMRSASERMREQNDNIEFQIGDVAFPQEATTVPEVAIRWRDTGKRLLFRWYKLTSHSKTRDWVEALARRQPLPLAIIGGGNSYSGLELARQMRRVFLPLAENVRPLLLLTTATADRTTLPDKSGTDPSEVDVHELYPQRTFRFCFTNRQMAVATTRFLWQQDDLRPEADPVFTVSWNDDSYSGDLLTGYEYALRPLKIEAIVREWLWWSGSLALGMPALPGANLPGVHMRPEFSPQPIFSSVGTYHAPNNFESTAVGFLVRDLDPLPKQRRMLIVAGQFQPLRRFLQSLARRAPEAPQRLVVVTGDTVSFNHIYRDRLAAWRTQELPFPLVFFCHRNPIDAAAGFDPNKGHVTGTEDVLLFRDLVEAVTEAFDRVQASRLDVPALHKNLLAMRFIDGQLRVTETGLPLFSEDGHRRGGTGEHVVYLRPIRKGDLVLSEADAEVWTRDVIDTGKRVAQWRRIGILNVPDPQSELEGGSNP